MPQPTGTPTWIDLGSNKAESSRAFYQGLFGWSFADQGEEAWLQGLVDDLVRSGAAVRQGEQLHNA